MSCSEAEGEHNDGILWPAFPESISEAPRCVPGLLQVKQGCLSHRKAGGVLQSSVSLVPGDGS